MTDERRRRFSFGSLGALALKEGGAGYSGDRRRGSVPIADVVEKSPSVFRRGR